MRYENDHIVTDYSKRAKTDQYLKGLNKIIKEKGKKNWRETEGREIWRNMSCFAFFIFWSNYNSIKFLRFV